MSRCTGNASRRQVKAEAKAKRKVEVQAEVESGKFRGSSLTST
jgi:hypothetical protein